MTDEITDFVNSLPNVEDELKSSMLKTLTDGLDVCMLFIIDNDGIKDGTWFALSPVGMKWKIAQGGDTTI